MFSLRQPFSRLPGHKTAKMNTTATIQFLGDYTQPLRLHGVTRNKDHCPLVGHSVEIDDARGLSSTPRLDIDGFTLLEGDQIETSGNPQTTTEQHLRQSMQLLQDLIGASELILLNTVIRRSEQSPGYLKNGTTLPARFAHSDFGAGEREIERWVNRFVISTSYERIKHKRIAVYNIWRVLTLPPTDVPLALCDVSSLDPDDRLGVEFHEQMPHSKDWVFEMSVYQFNPDQRWNYFTDMQTHELLVFKGFDSDTSRAALTPHAAFTLADCPADAPPRESIESRFLAIF